MSSDYSSLGSIRQEVVDDLKAVDMKFDLLYGQARALAVAAMHRDPEANANSYSAEDFFDHERHIELLQLRAQLLDTLVRLDTYKI